MSEKNYAETLGRSTLTVSVLLDGLKKASSTNKKSSAQKQEKKGNKKQQQGGKGKQGDAEKLDRAQVDPICGVKVREEIANERFYLTTAINYTNGAPHAGHAYEGITSDVIARYHRGFGRDTFFLTGSDEHGQKVEQSAQKEGVTPQAIADKYSSGFKALNAKLNISNDFYIRTTMKHHYKLAQTLWEKVRANGDIYLKDYVGWYNVHEERYVTDSEAEASNYQDEHGRPFEKKSEESYFFRMSRYQDQLVKYITEENPKFIQPEARKKEMLAFLQEPLLDLCISRTVCQWGVPCPHDPDYKGEKNHVMYVWFDALSNYLSGVNYFRDEDPGNWKRFWPCNVHIIGKDIVRFHCVIWPCMLMSAGVPLPRAVFGHGFVVAADGVKMSKSLGNVVDPNELLKRYPADALRFYISRGATYSQDFPFSEESMCSLCNASLKDGFGNLIHRGTSLAKAYCDGKIPQEKPHLLEGKLPLDVKALKAAYEIAFSVDPSQVQVPADCFHSYGNLEMSKGADGLQIQIAAEAVCEAIGEVNRYLQESAPWALKGAEHDATKRAIVRGVLESVYVLAHFLLPFTPNSMAKVFDKLGVKQAPISNLNANLENLPPGTTTYVGEILFNPLEPGKGEIKEATTVTKDKGDAKKQYEKAKQAKLAKKKEAVANQKKNQQVENNGPDFTKLDFRVGKIVKVWPHESADRLFCEEIDVGEDKPRQIASGLREHYKVEDMQNRMVVVCCNLKPRKLAGFESNGMVICATSDDKSKVEILTPPAGSAIGTRIGLEGLNIADYPAFVPNQVAKKKVFETVAADFKTNGDMQACWQNIKLDVDGKGVCTVPSLANSHLS